MILMNMVKTRSQPKFLFQLGMLLCACSVGNEQTLGQQIDASISLGDVRVDVVRLSEDSPPTSRSGSTVFLVDDNCTVTIDILSEIGSLTTSIDTACQVILLPETVGDIGGKYRYYEVPASVDGTCILFPTLCVPAHHYVYSFPSLAAGEYTINYTAPAGLEGLTEVAVIASIETSSPVQASLVPTVARVKNGDHLAISAIVFDGTNPVVAATASARIKRPNQADYDAPVPLLDSGDVINDGDNALEDGVYSMKYTPPDGDGIYEVLGDVDGDTSQNNPFSRQVATRFEVYTPTAVFSPTALNLTDQGVDDNGNILFDRVEVSVDVDVSSVGAGEYELIVVLSAPTLSELLVAKGKSSLIVGNAQQITASIPARMFLSLDDWGQFTIDRLEITYLGPGGADPAVVMDTFYPQSTLTSDYQELDIERPDIVVRTDEVTHVATDTDDPVDGTFDILKFTVPVDFRLAGTYQFSGTVSASCGLNVFELELFKPIETVQSEITVIAGWTNPVNVDFVFDGHLIGAFGLDGPYTLQNLSVTGPASTTYFTVADTGSSYVASNFDGFIAAVDCK